jgi:hypothetical protein
MQDQIECEQAHFANLCETAFSRYVDQISLQILTKVQGPWTWRKVRGSSHIKDDSGEANCTGEGRGKAINGGVSGRELPHPVASLKIERREKSISECGFRAQWSAELGDC